LRAIEKFFWLHDGGKSHNVVLSSKLDFWYLPRVFQSGEERKGKERKGKVCVDYRICGVEPLEILQK
jgi:hypothetical protein